MTKKYKGILIFIVIIVIQVLVLVYWSNKKTNYHVDELYSMGYASCFTGEGDITWYITTSREFCFDKWIKVSELKKYILLSDEEKFFNAPVMSLARKLTGLRNYFGFLNIAESVADTVGVPLKGSLMLNVLLFAISEVFLIRLMKKLHTDYYVQCLSLTMFGFSSYMISMVEYVRFYMLLMMIALIVFNLLYDVWSTNKWLNIIAAEMGMGLFVYFAYLNSELTMPFFGALLICFIVALLCAKKWRQFILNVVVLVLGLVYLSITTSFLGILFNPKKYAYLENVWSASGQNIFNSSPSTVKEYFIWLKQLFESHFFSNLWMVYLLLGAVTICIIIASELQNEKKLRLNISNLNTATVCAFFFWIFVYIISSISGHGRAFSIVMVLSIIILGIGELIGFRPKIRRITLSNDTLFVAVITGELVIYTLFEALCRHEIWRYYCYGFVSFFIVIWYMIDRVMKKESLQYVKRPVIVILTVFVAINALIPFKTRNIENIYEDERVFIENVRNHRDLDVVLISEVEGETVSRHEAYDCINLMPQESNVLFVDIAEYKYSKEKYPDQFILWSYIERDITEVIKDLKGNGYTIEDMGNDHCSKAYVCKK